MCSMILNHLITRNSLQSAPIFAPKKYAIYFLFLLLAQFLFEYILRAVVVVIFALD